MATGEIVAQGLKIDWAQMPTYNTVMSVAAGAGLLMVVGLMRRLGDADRPLAAEGWAMGFGVVGAVLAVTGLHMTLTWPLAAGGFPFDNVIFGEPSLAFGVLLLFAAFYLWKRAEALEAAPDRFAMLAAAARPVSVFVLGMGLACFGIAAAGVGYELFAAPPEEPISGEFAEHPMIEAVFISGLYALVGVGAVLFPLALRPGRRAVTAVVLLVWFLSGLAFLLFGALNYFTHIGLIVNTM
ncbi:DUF981 family protein [Glycomyces tenuis]|uniref:DUF981 family protein n=1 Tax=Glycomyces tenuis TaxID=58116 RepID=UPI00042708F7|nr:DUF981 family protein [Glycomyces tenuis]